MDITNCLPVSLEENSISCATQKKDASCNIVNLINEKSCIGAAVYTINTNFYNLNNFISTFEQNAILWENIINNIKNTQSKWENAYNIFCSLSANWENMADVADYVNTMNKPPVVVFYHQIYDYITWNNYNSTQKNNILNDPVTKWVNNMYPASNYSLDSTLVCYILFKNIKDINVQGAGTGKCPVDGIIKDGYLKTSIAVTFNINNAANPVWEI